MNFVVDHLPTQKLFLQNMEVKMKEREFLDDTVSLLRANEKYDNYKAYELIKTNLTKKDLKNRLIKQNGPSFDQKSVFHQEY